MQEQNGKNTHKSNLNLKPRLHDTAGCQTGCQTGLTTGLTTGWMFVYTIQPVVKPVVQPVFDNRLYRVNGV